MIPPSHPACPCYAPTCPPLQVLADLVLLHFNPDIEPASLVCQALPVFFQNYAELTSVHQQFLATAFLPAARL